jgi:hypothetical protein
MVTLSILMGGIISNLFDHMMVFAQ